MNFETEENEIFSSESSFHEYEDQVETNLEKEPEFNDELFLKQICNFPGIYNNQSKGYSNRSQKLRAWENIARSMGATVEFCTKRWKSLREKYHREKQKYENLCRSGAAGTSIPTWQFMSFFEFMYDKVTPRQTSSSIIEENIRSNPGILTHHNVSAGPSTLQTRKSGEVPNQHTNSQVQLETAPGVRSTRKTQLKRKHEKEDPVLGVLERIGNALQEGETTTSNKIDDFSKYLASEIRDLPATEQTEFMDGTLIRLLQVKRKNR